MGTIGLALLTFSPGEKELQIDVSGFRTRVLRVQSST